MQFFDNKVSGTLQALPFFGHPRIHANGFHSRATRDGLDIGAARTSTKKNATLPAHGTPGGTRLRRTRALRHLGLDNPLCRAVIHLSRMTGEEMNPQFQQNLRGQGVHNDDKNEQGKSQREDHMHPLAQNNNNCSTNPLQAPSNTKQDQHQNEGAESPQEVFPQGLAAHSDQMIGPLALAIGLEQPAQEPQEEPQQ